MTHTLTVIAFESDVRCQNAHLAHRRAWIVTDYGLTGPIGPPLAVRPAVTGIDLFPHEAHLTPEGYAKLAADAAKDDAALLGLTPEEAFGLKLCLWRWRSSPEFNERERKDYGFRACQIARYKATLAREAGHTAQAERLADAEAALAARYRAELAEERRFNREFARAFSNNGGKRP